MTARKRTSPQLGDLPPTAQRLLEGARRLLERSGYAALTLDAVAREAGETKSLIRYHFGSKQGLLVALADWIVHDYTDRQRRLVTDVLDGEDRLRGLTESLSLMVEDEASYRAFFDLMANLVRDPELRGRAAGLFLMWRQLTASVLLATPAEGVPKLTMTLASMTVALADGLALQLLADPDAVDVELAMAQWQTFLVGALEAGGER